MNEQPRTVERRDDRVQRPNGSGLRGFCVRLEDDMVITEDGAELFTPQSMSLDDPFADVP